MDGRHVFERNTSRFATWPFGAAYYASSSLKVNVKLKNESIKNRSEEVWKFASLVPDIRANPGLNNLCARRMGATECRDPTLSGHSNPDSTSKKYCATID
jgi:hypothetical protein